MDCATLTTSTVCSTSFSSVSIQRRDIVIVSLQPHHIAFVITCLERIPTSNIKKLTSLLHRHIPSGGNIHLAAVSGRRSQLVHHPLPAITTDGSRAR